MLLGIDIGTTNVKLALVEAATCRVLHRQSRPLGALEDVSTPGAAERSVSSVFRAIEAGLLGLVEDTGGGLGEVEGVGVCGQMHGCVLWSSRGGELFDTSSGNLRATDADCSNLITWQDTRCDATFLSCLPRISSDEGRNPPVSAGYGCATLAWLQREKPEVLLKYDKAGTVMDMVVCALCSGGRGEVVMSSQNAASWGYFDQTSLKWYREILKGLFPLSLLPEVVGVPHMAGGLVSEWHGVPRGARVSVAMGDMQCSVLAAKPTLTDIVLNMGSASQLALIKPHHTTEPSPAGPLPPSVTQVPYFNDQQLLVAAALGGGDTLGLFIRRLQSWFSELGVGDPRIFDFRVVFERVMELAAEKVETELRIDPRVWGDRHAPTVRGRVWDMGLGNLGLGDVGSAVVRGVVENLREMMSTQLLEQHQVKRVLGTGKLLQKHRVFREHISRVFRLPLILNEDADAPLGAAIAAARLL